MTTLLARPATLAPHEHAALSAADQPSSVSQAPSNSAAGPSSSAASNNFFSASATTKDPHSLPGHHVAHPDQPVLYLPPLLPPVPTAPSPGLLDPASLSLHKALHSFRPFPSYASLPYTSAFNWSTLELELDQEREWYCVVFRSKRNDRLDNDV